jgi:hypothetical protein
MGSWTHKPEKRQAMKEDRQAGRKELTDAEGPGGTYGCACLDRDSVQCAAIRYGMDHWGEACECLCHQWSDDDDDLG